MEEEKHAEDVRCSLEYATCQLLADVWRPAALYIYPTGSWTDNLYSMV